MLGKVATELMFSPIVLFLMLGTVTILSIFKPWPRTLWSRDAGAAWARAVVEEAS